MKKSHQQDLAGLPDGQLPHVPELLVPWPAYTSGLGDRPQRGGRGQQRPDGVLQPGGGRVSHARLRRVHEEA